MTSPEFCHDILVYKVCATNFDWTNFTLTAMATIAGLGSLLVAIWQIIALRRNNAEQTAITLIQDELNSDALRRARVTYLEAIREAEGRDLSEVVSVSAITDQREAIRLLLNRYEAVALAISHKAVSERVYKEYAQSTVIADWHRLRGFVLRVRTEVRSSRLWHEFEKLARRWQDEKTR